MRLRRLFREAGETQESSDAETTSALHKLDGLWDDLFPTERERIVQMLLESVTLRTDELELSVWKKALEALAMEMSNGKCQMTNDKVFDNRHSEIVTCKVPMILKKKSGRKEIVPPPAAGHQSPAAVQNPLVLSLARAHRWRDLLASGTFHSIGELAETISVDRAYIGRLLNLTLLAPDILSAILDGNEPSGLSLEKLTRNTPLSWREQRRCFGVVS